MIKLFIIFLRRTFILVSLVLIEFSGFSFQKKKLPLRKRSYVPKAEEEEKRKCSEYIYGISYYWRKDSIPDTGFRRCVATNFHNVIIDSVSYHFVLKMLGKPSKPEDDSNEETISLRYTYYDYKKMPVDVGGPAGRDEIAFIFDRKSMLLVRIGFGGSEY